MAQAIKDVMTRDPVCVEPHDTAADAAKRMRDVDSGAILVAEDGHLRGLLTDRDMAYDAMLGAHLRLTAVTPGPGRCGFAGLGGSGLLPWHGTAAVDRRGVLSTDFAISLLDRAFVPVYADVLGGAEQPWFMAPITAIEPAGSAGPASGPARLSDAFLDTVRLRTH